MKMSEYQKILEICNPVSSMTKLHSTLNKILITTEDQKLKGLLELIVPDLGQKLAAQMQLKSSGRKAKLSVNFGVGAWLPLLSYCKACGVPPRTTEKV